MLVIMLEAPDLSSSLRSKLQLYAEKIAESCAVMYLSGPLGLPPEQLDFQSSRPHSGRTSYLRPEIIESLTYLWHSTHKIKYRNLGWQYILAIMSNGRVKHGLCSVSDAGAAWPRHTSCRQDTWILAETLKYALLLFSSKSLISQSILKPALSLPQLTTIARSAVATLFDYKQVERDVSPCPASSEENLSNHLCPMNLNQTYAFERITPEKEVVFDLNFICRREFDVLDSLAYRETLGDGILEDGFTPSYVLTTEAHPMPIFDSTDLC
eukprot:Blabericola_migrator_1__9483@NODE_514_length_7930_cov_31_119166_g275_i1_p4_GENE_NODE_514_length_7930_cov_31_119166_g275_i1NODE_514_length_7930_cov_31_119166_g275_i1_p4_ORF_typecomplete_len268_score43_21Glyco_hydro_47/PF01532_20/1e24Glyco_hydro_47/PF01532_20/3_2_NODE_514_length_7930_cov_31_119166_g275_i1128931